MQGALDLVVVMSCCVIVSYTVEEAFEDAQDMKFWKKQELPCTHLSLS